MIKRYKNDDWIRQLLHILLFMHLRPIADRIQYSNKVIQYTVNDDIQGVFREVYPRSLTKYHASALPDCCLIYV